MPKKETVTIEFTGESGSLIKELNKVTGALQKQEKQAADTAAGMQKIAAGAGAFAAAERRCAMRCPLPSVAALR